MAGFQHLTAGFGITPFVTVRESKIPKAQEKNNTGESKNEERMEQRGSGERTLSRHRRASHARVASGFDK